jgi:thiol-disulfide isomerase/thioredoxin
VDIKFIYHSAEWCGPCKRYWPQVLRWSVELNAEVTKVDLSDGFVDDIKSVPTMDVVVGGTRKLRVTQWGPGTKARVLEAINDGEFGGVL